MIDSHCHLDHEPLHENINKVITRSKDIGVTKLLTICTSFESFNKIIEIVKIDPIIYGTYGIHPHECEKNLATKKLILNSIKNNKKIIGVGETGLDFHYNHSIKKTQISSFVNHIEAAIDLNVPIIVHSRNAEVETYEILNEYKRYNPKILMHCFTGSTIFANNLLSLNAFFSASGIITFKNTVELQNTFSLLPVEKLLIETDSPFLAPAPMRGKKNEPSYIKYTALKLAELKKLSFAEIDKITSNNFNLLFKN
jgi:TatD DNase family protein